MRWENVNDWGRWALSGPRGAGRRAWGRDVGAVRRGARRGRRGGRVHVTPALVSLPLSRDAVCHSLVLGVHVLWLRLWLFPLAACGSAQAHLSRMRSEPRSGFSFLVFSCVEDKSEILLLLRPYQLSEQSIMERGPCRDPIMNSSRVHD